MANTLIQIKSSTSNAAPTTLNVAEPAYSYVSNTLFIGTTGSNGVIAIGGQFYVDQQSQIFAKTNAAFAAANTGSGSNSAGLYANSAFNKANAAYDNSNTKLSSSGGTITGPISGLGNSKLDFTTYGSNTVYLTTTNDDSTALFMGAATVDLYANTSITIRANTKGTSQNWTFGEDGILILPASGTISGLTIRGGSF
jgi:hypothetical protein